jgi:hypothetical protein
MVCGPSVELARAGSNPDPSLSKDLAPFHPGLARGSSNLTPTGPARLSISQVYADLYVLGPGDGLLSSLLAPAAFSSGLVLLDVGDYAHKNIKHYLAQVRGFIEKHLGAELPDYSVATDVPSMLSKANGRYLCEGLESLRSLEDESFDLIFSQAVLEHVRKAEFAEIIQQSYRLVKTNGIVSHVIDFKDHLGGALNNMRISSHLWERPWFAARSGFYTNRLRLSEIVKICERVGFRVEVCNVRRWDESPINRTQLAHEFDYLSDEDLCVSGAHLIMRRQ